MTSLSSVKSGCSSCAPAVFFVFGLEKCSLFGALPTWSVKAGTSEGGFARKPKVFHARPSEWNTSTYPQCWTSSSRIRITQGSDNFYISFHGPLALIEGIPARVAKAFVSSCSLLVDFCMQASYRVAWNCCHRDRHTIEFQPTQTGQVSEGRYMRCCRLPLCFWRLREAISCLQDCRTCWRRCKERAILRIIKTCIYIYSYYSSNNCRRSDQRTMGEERGDTRSEESR